MHVQLCTAVTSIAFGVSSHVLTDKAADAHCKMSLLGPRATESRDLGEICWLLASGTV